MRKTDKTIQTYSKIYQDYANRNTLNSNIAILLDKFIDKLKGKSVLDVGCAQGRDSCYFSEKGYDVVGIDLTPEFIDLAKINCPKATFKLMDMRHLNFQPNLFDGIWACASFLHIPKNEALKTLKSFRKVLKPDGIFFVSVMEGDSEGLRKNDKLKWGDRYFSHYQTAELEKLLNNAEFNVIELIKSPTSWGPMFLNYYCHSHD
jgi:2-polyprenyl-3-methyl-5-hydroxy-6-metoxy-1,4-benzoquinol methylase